MRKDERRKNMKDNSKITITVAEYKRLLQADIMLDIMTNRAKSEKYFNGSEVKAMLGISEKEDEE